MAFLLYTFSFALITFDFIYGVKDVPSHVVEGLSGETIYLPCNVSTYEADEVVLILWYREDKGTPIYSVDIREGYLKALKRWSDETVFGERAYFIFNKEPGTLSIQSARFTDSGTYRCRVDFLKAQTRNSKITLTIIAPAETVIIRDDTGVERSTVVGPYSEGDIVTLRCEALGGNPSPKISWYRDETYIDYHMNLFSGEGFVQSEITLGPLSRSDLNSRITCKANNHPRATPVESAVQIDMNFSPLNIRLLGAHQALSAGRRYDLLCQSSGSRPPAVITWWLDGMRLEKTTETTSSDGNQTTSTLSITFTKTDAGKLLTCKAYNHAVPSEPLEDGWKLDIQYVPKAYVQLGTSLDINATREGTDVYFDCMVFAHPAVFRIEWRHNGKPLPRNISQGVIVSNHSLVLQGVTRSTAGNYSCVGYNAEGEGSSAPLLLNILYAPTCKPNQTRIYGVAKQEDAKINCSVDANPPDVDFSWTFNNSAESIDVATNHISKLGTSSIVTYTPITELDYGTLLCVATNKIGKQRIPCVYHIIAAGRPDQVHNCTLTNISMTSLTVTCTDGFNGGLPQLFTLELIDSQSNEIKANITSNNPRFTVSTLSPGGLYIISVYAFNSKGRSDPTILNAAMLRMPEKQLTFESGGKSRTDLLVSPMISLTFGLTLAVLVAGLAIIFALRIPCKRSGRQQKELPSEQNSRNLSPGPSEKSSGSKEQDGNDDDKNPDVIPEAMDPDEQIGYVKYKQPISTIGPSFSPTRNVLSNTPPLQQFTSEIPNHLSHNIGYCTLRSGLQHTSSHVGLMPMNITAHGYSSSIAQFTLPRHINQQLWPNCNSALTGVRNTQAISSMHQHSIPVSYNTSKMPGNSEPINFGTTENAVSTANLSSNNFRSHDILKEKPHVQRTICKGVSNCDKSAMEPSCLSDEEVTAQTPLMMKRESTV